MEQNKQLSDQIQERFISYYTRKFPSDLQSFYDIRGDFGDGTYPFVMSMTWNEHSNPHRRSMKWDGKENFNMFSVSVFFTSMCSQVINDSRRFYRKIPGRNRHGDIASVI